MKKIFLIIISILLACSIFSQEVLRIQNGGTVTIQNGANVVLQGGITLDNGSNLVNNGSLLLKNNPVANISNWTDNSLSGALSGTGIIIFNSTHPQQFTGLSNFYIVVINTNELSLNNDLNISNILRLVNGKINTGNYFVYLNNNAASSLETDAANATYSNSWINGTIKRLIATNTNSYDFPVGNSTRSNLLQFINNNLSGPSLLSSSFGLKQGTDAGLNVTENGNVYTAVNSGGVWYLIPNSTPTGGNYALQLYFNGFTGLSDNQFGILRRPDASSNAADWTVPEGSLLDPLNSAGRKVSDGFARRFNISDFSQLGIGQFTASNPAECTISGASQVCIGSTGNVYSAPGNMSNYSWIISGNGTIIGPTTGPSVSVTAGAAGSFNLSLTITDINGTTSQCTKTVNVAAAQPCTITGSATAVSGSTGNTYSGPVNMSSYSWTTSGNGTIIGSTTGASVSVIAGAPGTFTLHLNTTLNGCVSTCTKTVNVSATECIINGAGEVCNASAGISYSGPGGMSSYSWVITGNGSIIGSTTSSSVNVTAGAPGSFTLHLTATGPAGINQCTKTVSVVTALPCLITGSENVVTASTGHTYTGPANMSSYSWVVSGNGSIIGSTTGSSVSVTAGAPGSFTLTLNATMNGCISTCTKTVSILPPTECVINGLGEVCNASAGITYSAPAGMSSYSWIITGNGSIIGSTSSSSVNVTAGAPGSFTLQVTAMGPAGIRQCTKIVNVVTAQPCLITGLTNVVPASTGNTYTGPANMSFYSWIISGNGTIIGSITGTSVSVTAGAPGTFTLTLNATLNGCVSVCSKMVTINSSTLGCTVSGESQVCMGSTGNIYTAPVGLSTYSWTISGNGSIVGSTANASVNIIAGAVGSYNLTLQATLNGVSCTYTKTVVVSECVTACTYTQGFYGNKKGTACYNNSGTSVTSSQLMLNAFGATTTKVFGNPANARMFTLFKSDITSGDIYKMLPGGGPAKPIDADNILPFNGAYYSDENTWYLVPLQPNGPQRGKIRNSLLAQTITLWFNLANSNSLGSMSLLEDTLITKATTDCGSNTPAGEGIKFGLPHNVIIYLNGSNGYAATVNGLFELANDVLGGVNTSLNASDVQQAVDIINNVFDGCRILVGTIPYNDQLLVKSPVATATEITITSDLKVVAYPNPYKTSFRLMISSPVSGIATIEFFTMNGSKVYEMKKQVHANSGTSAVYTGPVRFATLIYKVTIGDYRARGIVIRPD